MTSENVFSKLAERVIAVDESHHAYIVNIFIEIDIEEDDQSR